MTPASLPPALRDLPDGGIFYLHGPERFQKEEAVRALAEHYVDPPTRDFNLDVLRGSDTDADTLARILATPPMMAPRRVVVVREVEALAGSSKAREVLQGLVTSPPPDLVAVLEATVPSGSKAKIYRQLAKDCISVEFGAVSDADVPGWLMARARDVHGRELEPDAARALGAGVGTELGVLAREVEKLVAMVEEGRAIGVVDVEAAGTRLPKQDRWRWFDLVGEKRFGEALAGLGVLFGQGENAVSLTIGLATHLLRLGVLSESGQGALEAVLPPHQKWLARRLQGQARKWSLDELDRAVLDLRRVDQLLKASPLPKEHLLEEWLLGVVVRARAVA